MSPSVVENRRRSPRTRVSCVVQLQPLDADGAETDRRGHTCMSMDASAGGMRIRSDRPYPVDARTLLSFECEEDGVRQVTSCVASVVWTDPVPCEGQWQMGVKLGDGESTIAPFLARACVCRREAPGEPGQQGASEASGEDAAADRQPGRPPLQ